MKTRSLKSKLRSTHNITRMDYYHGGKRSALGWAVRVSVRGKLHHKLFSDSKFGGPEEALAAAVAYRDKLLERVTNKMNRYAGPRGSSHRNTSGTIGVAKRYERGRFVGYTAYWSDPPLVQHCVRFSFARYGRAAKKMAVACRREQVARVRKKLAGDQR